MELRLEIVTLYRYFAVAAHMRSLFRRAVSAETLKTLTDDRQLILFFWSAPGIYFMYSYAGIYLVIEGWKDLKLADPKIDSLLASPFVDKLRRFRNATFHYQRDPLSLKHLEFFGTDEERTEEWLDELYREFERFFGENTLPMPDDLKSLIKDKPEGEVVQAIVGYWKGRVQSRRGQPKADSN